MPRSFLSDLLNAAPTTPNSTHDSRAEWRLALVQATVFIVPALAAGWIAYLKGNTLPSVFIGMVFIVLLSCLWVAYRTNRIDILKSSIGWMAAISFVFAMLYGGYERTAVLYGFLAHLVVYQQFRALQALLVSLVMLTIVGICFQLTILNEYRYMYGSLFENRLLIVGLIFSLLYYVYARHAESLAAALERANEALYRQARTDELTHLRNRRYVMEHFAEPAQRRLSNYDDSAVMILDIDHFKRINDQFGHGCGDQVLCRVGEILSRALRETDTVARWGGEEFLIILPGTPVGSAMLIAEKLRLLIEGHDFQHGDDHFAVTASIGLIGFDWQSATLQAALAAADLFLYEAKELGRNRVCGGLRLSDLD